MPAQSAKQTWTKGEWNKLQKRKISEAEYFGSVGDVNIADAASTITINCQSLDAVQQLADAANAALAHWKRAKHQNLKSKTVRSALLPIDMVKFTYHKATNKMTCLGFKRNSK
jgi:glucose-6-phosphate dehydrogenase assembly protein OpcA